MQPKTKLGFLIVLLIPCWVIAVRYNIDLVNLYGTAKLLLTDPTRVYESHDGLGRWFYGPFSLVLISPLAHVSYTVVKWFWIALQTFCFFAFWRQLERLFPFLGQRNVRWAWILVWIVAINPIHNNFQSNNIQLMLAALLLSAELLARADSPMARFFGGALVSVAAAIKVFPLFLCGYYFVTRRRAVRTGLVAGGLFTIAVPYLFYGRAIASAQFAAFFRNLTTYNQDNSPVTIPDILCVPSMLARWLTPMETIQATGQASHYARLAIPAVVAMLALAFYYSAWKASRQVTSGSRERATTYWWALAMALMALLNPSTRPHYFIFYVPAYCAALELLHLGAAGLGLRIGVVLSTLLVAFTAEGVLGKRLNDLAEWHSLPTYGAIVLCVGLVWVISRRAAAYLATWSYR